MAEKSIEMEPKLPVMAKKFWNVVRVLYFMLRKGISKRKLMLDLNIMMKRGKIAGKAFHNLMNWSSAAAAAVHRRSHDGEQISFPVPPDEYEFSCSNSPAVGFQNHHHHFFPFHFATKRKHHNNHQSHFFACAHPPAVDDDAATVGAVVKALEMLGSEAASPALPGFGRSPAVRQLRITDSPFPVNDMAGDSHVDEAAEEFIEKFYKNLRKQNAAASGYR